VFQIETNKHHELSISNQAIAVLRLLNVRTVLMAAISSLHYSNPAIYRIALSPTIHFTASTPGVSHDRRSTLLPLDVL
jgi:hypothetical protein